ncbi:DNA replication and repair protein RecN [Methylophilus rhizosphaerae]|uniref:DNA repair protein RecN n=1 Tax=Methylophilus rhizosphaerae TaxID=492660 RepID=A0A1G9BIL6_9PROT|nr:DNA repair protein RecN [Methylophilus rhizosphaerae]SDK39368.1 DNA replication and repair protein RecN [Methylophilus rhizosphaerae]
MLQALSIRDFVIVDTLELEFSAGYTALTGETGAGKSILIDALSLSLGARNEGDVTRKGHEKAEISTTFDIAHNQAARDWLQAQEMEVDEVLVLRRVIYADGRSRAFINGASATVGQLREIGETLIDIYSQNAHHSLLKLTTQRDILDAYAQATPLAKQVSALYKDWSQLHQQQLTYEKNASQFADELAELRDSTRELRQLEFAAEEWQVLQQEHVRLSNGASLLNGMEACLNMMSESDEVNAMDLLSQVQSKLAELQAMDAGLQSIAETLDSAVIQLEESSRALNRYLQRSELDPERLAEVEARIQAIHGVARKYRVKPEELPDLLDQQLARMHVLEGFADDGALAKQVQAAWQAYQQAAKQLSAQRQQAAKTLSQTITAQMQALSLKGGQFAIALTPGEAAAHGLEQVEFLVAGHAGVEPRSLNKVASGGELSRISLALQVTTASLGSVPCMIFDEVDVGIGGGVAEVVGHLLNQLGQQRQVLVITHLAQVASQAQQHLQVSKSEHNGTTLSRIRGLSADERVEEVARMLGGLQITEVTRNHAREMLKLAIH